MLLLREPGLPVEEPRHVLVSQGAVGGGAAGRAQLQEPPDLRNTISALSGVRKSKI